MTSAALSANPEWQQTVSGAPVGPLPCVPLSSELERRWLHYAFFSRDHRYSMVANLAWLGMPKGQGTGLRTAVLLLHDAEKGWACSQWNAVVGAAPWSAFHLPSYVDAREPSHPNRLKLSGAKGVPSVSMSFGRTSTPCAAQTATFGRPDLPGDQWMRWQSEPGVLSEGAWQLDSHSPPVAVEAVGYHERVRGRWGWAEMGGWVFGFCNVTGGSYGEAPPWSLVFTLLQPHNQANNYAASLMVWRKGRLVRHIPRRALRVSVAGQLDRDQVVTVPWMAGLFGTSGMAPIPAALCIDGVQGRDIVQMRFVARHAARLVIPSEASDRPYSVHEVVGHMEVSLELGGQLMSFQGPGIVEFAGGAAEGFQETTAAPVVG